MEITTPQEVILPKYDQNAKLEDRGVPPSILVSCKTDDTSGTVLLAAQPGKIISGSGNLAVDLLLITGSAIAASAADWRYEPMVAVTLK